MPTALTPLRLLTSLAALAVMSGCADTHEDVARQRQPLNCSPGGACPAGLFCVLGLCCDNPCGNPLCGVTSPLMCASGLVCAGGACVSACRVDGGLYDAGTRSDDCHICDPSISTLEWTVTAGDACNDNNLCSLGDRCDASGLCKPSSFVGCGDAGPCVDVGTCNPSLEGCPMPTLRADGTRCASRAAFCSSGACVNGCVIDGGVVAAGTNEPGNPCRGCDPAQSDVDWSPVDEGGACGDDSGCMIRECQLGACVKTGTRACPPLDSCHAAGTCDLQLDRCTAPAAQDGTPCDAGASCGVPDSCVSGTCVPTGCQCDEDAECPSRQCYESKCRSHACTFDVAIDGTPCDDGDACTTGESCQTGSCTAGVLTVCATDVECVSSTCDGRLGVCTSKAVADGVPCDAGECRAGRCEAPDGGVVPLGPVTFQTCGCGAAGGGFSVFALALLALRRRRSF